MAGLGLRTGVLVVAALMAVGCSGASSAGARLSQESADALAATIVLQPEDVGPGFVDDAASISEGGSIGSCLDEEPDAQPLAESSPQSFKSPEIAETASPEDVERLMQDIQSVVVASAVFSTESAASGAIASLTDLQGAPCAADVDTDGLVRLEALSVGDESVVFQLGEGSGFAAAFVRTGPVVTFVLSLRFDGEVDRSIMETVVAAVSTAVEESGT